MVEPGGKTNRGRSTTPTGRDVGVSAASSTSLYSPSAWRGRLVLRPVFARTRTRCNDELCNSAVGVVVIAQLVKLAGLVRPVGSSITARLFCAAVNASALVGTLNLVGSHGCETHEASARGATFRMDASGSLGARQASIASRGSAHAGNYMPLATGRSGWTAWS